MFLSGSRRLLIARKVALGVMVEDAPAPVLLGVTVVLTQELIVCS